VIVCAQCRQDNPAGARFCNGCAAPLEVAAAPGGEVRKVVTVVFCDMAGSTARADGADPEAVRAVLVSYYERMRAVLERHGGTVEKFIGDAVMAVFGVPVVREDDALRAVRAALEMRDALVEAGITARIGVNTGEVVAHHHEALVTGDAVNVAARLEQAAPVGDVLIGDSTLTLVRDAVVVEPVAALTVKGKREPLVAWRLVAAVATGPGVARRSDAALVGRARERRLLWDAYEQAEQERRCVLFTVLGMPGVGKSRLLADLAERVSGEAEVLTGSCLSYGEGVTYWPIAEIVRAAAGISDTDDAATAVAALERLAAGHEDAGVMVGQIAAAIGLGESASAPADIAWAVQQLLGVLSRERPLVVVFEDIHWAEPALFDLIEHIAAWSRDAPLLLCCTARPELLELRPAWAGGKTNATTMLLKPLPAGDCSTLCDQLLGTVAITGTQRRHVLEIAEGNPLFVEQMLAMIQTEGVELTDIPPSIDALLAARVDQLPADEREVVASASIEGRVFHRSAVAALLPDRPADSVDGQLLQLVRRELIDPSAAQFAGDRAFSFGHVLIREAAYRAIPKRTRAIQHEQFAAWLREKAADRVGEFEEILAHHLAQAVTFAREIGAEDAHTVALAERAARHYRRAADRALARGDLRAGADMLAQVRRLLPGGDPRIAVTLAMFALAVEFIGQEEANLAVDEALRLCADGGDEVIAGFVRAVGDWNSLLTDPTVDSSGFVDRLHALAPAAELAGEVEIAAWCWFLAAVYTVTDLQRPADALVELARVEAALQQLDSAWLADQAMSLRLFCRLWGPGRIPDLLAAEVPAHHARSTTMGSYLRYASALCAAQGDEVAALRMLDDETALLVKTGRLESTAFTVDWSRGLVYDLLGKPGMAIEHYRRALDACLGAGRTAYASSISGALASNLSRSGEHHQALEEASRAEHLTGPGDAISEILWRSARAHALAHLGRLDQAAELADEAVERVMSTQVPTCRFSVLMEAAEVHGLAGDGGRARALAAQAADESSVREAHGLQAQAEALLAWLPSS
jgi:class 3 adenylate cyclase/tetratricopeptide (TPR) repeat protein